MMIRAVLLFGFIIIAVGCASFASNQRACQETDFLLPLPNVFIGNVFQVSPCTSIEAFRIETGVELKQYKSSVYRAVESGQINNEFEVFVKRMGCPIESKEKFLNMLVKNEEQIFGPHWDRSNRQIVKSIRLFTKTDPNLKECWEN